MSFTKHDKDKVRPDLIPARPLIEVARVLTDGAATHNEGFGERNWLKCDNYMRYLNATERHIWAHKTGEFYDQETGHSHISHGCANLLIVRDILGFRVQVTGEEILQDKIDSLKFINSEGYKKDSEAMSEEEIIKTTRNIIRGL